MGLLARMAKRIKRKQMIAELAPQTRGKAINRKVRRNILFSTVRKALGGK